MTIEFPTVIQISFHKFTLTLFLQVLKFLSFNGINYRSHAKVLCTFKLNTFNASLRQKLRRHLKMMAVIPPTDFMYLLPLNLKQFWFVYNNQVPAKEIVYFSETSRKYLWLFKFTQKGQKSLFIKDLLTQPPRPEKGKLIIIKNPIK